jgi:hypothetical protein
MARIASLLLLVLLSICGCASSPTVSSTGAAKLFGKEDPLPVTPRVLEQLPADRYYRIRMFDPRISYVGKVVRASADEVVLTDVEYESRTTSKVPLLGDVPIPAFKRAFVNTGVGVNPLYGEWTFQRSQVTGVELIPGDRAELRHVAASGGGQAMREQEDPQAELDELDEG